jgi:16S rRNA (cytidine1402-2'-O)-methyltransferase
MTDEFRKTDPAVSPTAPPSEVRPGTLYLVGTPIGNLGDMSPRAAAILADVDLVAAEDTRRTLRLLNHLGLRKRLDSNWQNKSPLLLSALLQGRSVALVSDAGMPCISDPGFELVRLCAEHGLTVTTIPGPCAAIVGLAGSGLISDRFVFEGFLPASGKARKARLAELAAEPRTSVLYEAPHRLRRTLNDLAAAGMAGRQLTLARELTKRHEEYLRLTVGSAISHYAERDPRGEYVLVLEGREAACRRQPESAAESLMPDESDTSVFAGLRDCKARGLSVKDAVRQCAAASGRKKNDVYQIALRIWADM